MKAITLWQPWASLIRIVAKQIETRSWYTSYRGPLAIHASAKSPDCPPDLLDYLISQKDTWLKLEELALKHGPTLSSGPISGQPCGVILATCTLTDCRQTGLTNKTPWWLCELEGTPEMRYGDYGPGRYAWILEDIKPVDPPVQVKGRQGLWEWDHKGNCGDCMLFDKKCPHYPDCQIDYAACEDFV